MESGTEYDELKETEQKEATASALIRYLAVHAQYDAALLFTRGQYILYYRRGPDLICKGLAAESLRAAFMQEPVDSGWLPEGVVRCGSGPAGTFLVKFIPPKKHRLHLSSESQPSPFVITSPLPALVFAGVHTTYYVWALKTDHFHPSAPLFHAPLPNVYADGHICWGTNRPPEASAQTMKEAWRLFISSPFNQDLAAGRSEAYPQDVRRQLLALAEARESHYPVEDLVSYFRRSLWNSGQEIRTLNDAVEYYLLRKGTDQWLSIL
jgi:PRTRC genetic system protein B